MCTCTYIHVIWKWLLIWPLHFAKYLTFLSFHFLTHQMGIKTSSAEFWEDRLFGMCSWYIVDTCWQMFGWENQWVISVWIHLVQGGVICRLSIQWYWNWVHLSNESAPLASSSCGLLMLIIVLLYYQEHVKSLPIKWASYLPTSFFITVLSFACNFSIWWQ